MWLCGYISDALGDLPWEICIFVFVIFRHETLQYVFEHAIWLVWLPGASIFVIHLFAEKKTEHLPSRWDGGTFHLSPHLSPAVWEPQPKIPATAGFFHLKNPRRNKIPFQDAYHMVVAFPTHESVCFFVSGMGGAQDVIVHQTSTHPWGRKESKIQLMAPVFKVTFLHLPFFFWGIFSGAWERPAMSWSWVYWSIFRILLKITLEFF